MTNAPTTRETADHAELKRLAEAATPGRWTCKEGSTSYPECDDRDFWSVVLSPAGREIVKLNERGYHREDDRVDYDFDAAFIAAANPATVLALLSEIAALRGSLIKANSGFEEYERKFYLEQDDREQAERQRDELRKALEDHDQTAAECRIDGVRPQRDTTAPCELCGATRRESCGRKGGAAYAFISSARTLLANQGADQ